MKKPATTETTKRRLSNGWNEHCTYSYMLVFPESVKGNEN